MLSEKTVLITGCGHGGLGAALAKTFCARGYHVFATIRDKTKAGSLGQIEGVEILELELTSDESIRQCAAAVEKGRYTVAPGAIIIFTSIFGTALLLAPPYIFGVPFVTL